MAKKQSKGPIAPKRATTAPKSNGNDDRDRSTGLWVDYDLLRRHQGRDPQVEYDTMPSTNNRYLDLADIALGTTKPRKKTKIDSEAQ
jgi:hypothetical protein